ncbi:uncharacterized protein LAESUDRAFT_388249 [Laetiporus sulphureus 93-53]|uniref:Uncharacterized protein n=1 Tax=Laetiporus sulphureus 93-53 TaxID=1314785 RepID=A0A165CGQ3_9APHY|nr:uncharacterized protein LAESUDRAFT_388249 [Laetiporus sulphureus 93-53]KZT02776.1 hypothetical protein LAESUDRAFT_388249 [Laetiporus sulphureus 93-53]
MSLGRSITLNLIHAPGVTSQERMARTIQSSNKLEEVLETCHGAPESRPAYWQRRHAPFILPTQTYTGAFLSALPTRTFYSFDLNLRQRFTTAVRTGGELMSELSTPYSPFRIPSAEDEVLLRHQTLNLGHCESFLLIGSGFTQLFIQCVGCYGP